MMRENIYQTLCPGCNMGCGLYIRENEELRTSIDFRKSSPVNLGKLCRFGMRLHQHYKVGRNKVDNKECSIEDAIECCAYRLKNAKNLAFVSVGGTTMEEHLAFTKIARSVNAPIYTGVSAYSKIPANCLSFIKQNSVSLDMVENANRIITMVDPYLQYPLLLRRLLIAKKNGAKITAISQKKVAMADEILYKIPENYADMGLNSESIIITDVHPHSEAEEIEYLISVASKTSAKILFMKPFINATGVLTLNEILDNDGLDEILSRIDKGDIKTLAVLDTDIIEIMPQTEKVIGTLKKLKNLIVISSRESPINSIATVVIATESVYAKAGGFMNVEGEVIYNSGDGTIGIDALSEVYKNIKGEEFDYDSLKAEVGERLAAVSRLGVLCRDIEYEGPSIIKKPVEQPVLVSIYNPFMWFDAPDDNDFVIVNRKMVEELGLRKGGRISLQSDLGDAIKMQFRIDEVPDNVIISNKKLSITMGTETIVKTG